MRTPAIAKRNELIFEAYRHLRIGGEDHVEVAANFVRRAKKSAELSPFQVWRLRLLAGEDKLLKVLGEQA